MRRPAALAALAAMLACAPPAEQAAAPPAVDTAGFTQAITDLWTRYEAADTAGDVATLLGLYAPTARLDMPGAPPILGHAQLEPVIRSLSATRKLLSLKVTPISTNVVDNHLAYQGGTFSEAFRAGGRDSAGFGRYITAIVRDSAGTLRIAYLMAFADSTVARRQP